MSAAACCIRVENAVTGDLIGTVEVSSISSLAHLFSAVEVVFGRRALCRHRLLHNDSLLEPGPKTCEAVGFTDGCTVQVVASPEPARCRWLGTCCASNEGYHCHDTFLMQLASTEPGSFYVYWGRGFYGESWRTRTHDEKSRVRSTELAVLSVMQLEASPGGGMTGDVQVSIPSADSVVCIPGSPVWWNCLGMHRGHPIICKSALHNNSWDSAETLEIQLLSADGSRRALWCASECGVLAEHFRTEKVAMKQCFFIGDRLIMTASCHGDDEVSVLFEGDLVKDGAGLLLGLTLRRGVRVGAESLHSELEDRDSNMQRFEFLAVDLDTTVLFVRNGRGVLAISLETLQPRLVAELPQGWACMDPATLDLYVLFDKSRECYDTPGEPDTCWIYRTRSLLGASAADVRYDTSVFELVCKAAFVIDGFSDSFCVCLACYNSAADSFVFIDAESGVWSLPLKDARFQESLDVVSFSPGREV